MFKLQAFYTILFITVLVAVVCVNGDGGYKCRWQDKDFDSFLYSYVPSDNCQDYCYGLGKRTSCKGEECYCVDRQ